MRIAALADSFSLRERAIDRVVEGVESAEIERLLELIEDGSKVMWR